MAVRAVAGELSWRQVAKDTGYPHHSGIKNHMEKHFEAPPTPEERAMIALKEDGTLEDMVAALKRQATTAPPEIAPLYAVAARNLAGLEETKPSQQHLIQSLKAIQEMTGMKSEQRIMLAFAQHMFGTEQVLEASDEALAELQSGEYIDAEVIEDKEEDEVEAIA